MSTSVPEAFKRYYTIVINVFFFNKIAGLCCVKPACFLCSFSLSSSKTRTVHPRFETWILGWKPLFWTSLNGYIFNTSRGHTGIPGLGGNGILFKTYFHNNGMDRKPSQFIVCHLKMIVVMRFKGNAIMSISKHYLFVALPTSLPNCRLQEILYNERKTEMLNKIAKGGLTGIYAPSDLNEQA